MVGNTEAELGVVNEVAEETGIITWQGGPKIKWSKRTPRRKDQGQGVHQRDAVKKKKAGKAPSKKDIETVAVMFVDQTVGGMLTKRLQRAEDAIARWWPTG